MSYVESECVRECATFEVAKIRAALLRLHFIEIMSTLQFRLKLFNFHPCFRHCSSRRHCNLQMQMLADLRWWFGVQTLEACCQVQFPEDDYHHYCYLLVDVHNQLHLSRSLPGVNLWVTFLNKLLFCETFQMLKTTSIMCCPLLHSSIRHAFLRQ